MAHLFRHALLSYKSLKPKLEAARKLSEMENSLLKLKTADPRVAVLLNKLRRMREQI